MSTYHNKMMNLPLGESCPDENPALLVYKMGHRDARHAAAEIALEADREIQMLRDTLETCLECLVDQFALFSDEIRGAPKR